MVSTLSFFGLAFPSMTFLGFVLLLLLPALDAVTEALWTWSGKSVCSTQEEYGLTEAHGSHSAEPRSYRNSFAQVYVEPGG